MTILSGDTKDPVPLFVRLYTDTQPAHLVGTFVEMTKEPHRWLVTSSRKESVYRSLAAAKKVAGKKGRITPLYK